MKFKVSVKLFPAKKSYHFLKKNFIGFGLLTVFFISCSKDPSILTVKNLEGNDIKVIGHGGMGNIWKFPINTIRSVHECLNSGADGVEMDLQLTNDSVLVAFHSQTLENATTCNGKIYYNDWPDIENCRYKFFSPLQHKVVRIKDLLGSIPSPNEYYYFFDCKLYTENNYSLAYLNQFANSIIQVLDEFGISESVFIESVNVEFLKLLKKKKKDIRLFIYPPDFGKGLEISKNLNLFGISFKSKEVSKEQIESAHVMGFRIALWGVDSEHKNMEAVKKNPDYIQTDNVRYLVKKFGKDKR